MVVWRVNLILAFILIQAEQNCNIMIQGFSFVFFGADYRSACVLVLSLDNQIEQIESKTALNMSTISLKHSSLLMLCTCQIIGKYQKSASE